MIIYRRPGFYACIDLRGGGAEAEIQLFQNMAMLHIKLKRLTHVAACGSMAANILPAEPPDAGVRSQCQNSTFFL